MLKFEDLYKTLDGYLRAEIYEYKTGDLIFNGKLKDLKKMPGNVVRVLIQRTSREAYLEIYVYWKMEK